MCPGYTWKWLVLVVNQWIHGLIWSLGVVQLERPCCSSFYHTKQSWLRSARVRGRWGYGLVNPEPKHKRLRAQNDRKMDLDFSQVPCWSGEIRFHFCIATILRGASHLPRLTQGESRTHGIRLNTQNHGFWAVKKHELVGGTPTNDQPTWDLPESCFRPKLLHEPWFESFLVLRPWSWSH